MHIAVATFAAAWGVKLTREPDENADAAAPAEAGVPGPSIAEMAALGRLEGDDTIAASVRIMKAVREGGGG